jgi:hypothetical protein
LDDSAHSDLLFPLFAFGRDGEGCEIACRFQPFAD